MNYVAIFVSAITGIIGSIKSDNAAARSREELVTKMVQEQDYSGYWNLALIMSLVALIVIIKLLYKAYA